MSFLSSSFTVVSQTLERQKWNGSAPALNAHVPCEVCQTPSPRGVISQVNVYLVLRHKKEVRKPQAAGCGVWGCFCSGKAPQEVVLALFFMLLAQNQSCEKTLSVIEILSAPPPYADLG